MSALIFIATQLIKPALFILMIASIFIATLIIAKPNKGAKPMPKIDTRQVRKMIRIFGRAKVKEILKHKGLTFEDLGIS